MATNVNGPLQGRVALLTGAAGHLGPALAEGLATAGAHVILAGRRAQALADLQATLVARKLRASTLTMDVTDQKSTSDGLASIEATHGRLHVLVNNAYAGGAGAVVDSSDEAFREAYEVAVVGAFRLVRDGLSLLQAGRKDGDAAVVNIASMYGTVSPDPTIYGLTPPNPPFYGAAKGALLQLTRYLAVWLGPQGIRVNAISPGPFPRPTVEERDPAFAAALTRKVPLGRLGKPSDLASGLVFLASPGASFVTGINLPVDGGWTAQ